MVINNTFFHRYRSRLLLLVVGLVVAALLIHGPIPQIAGYNDFANQSTWLGVPHAENVLTNLPFLVLGIFGLWRIRYFTIEGKIERLAWMGFLVGVTLTAFGSSYYHLAPDNDRLMWDRLPITFSFNCLFTAVLAERVSERFANLCFIPMVIYSMISVVYWHWTENLGIGDMRPYILVQIVPILLIPLLMTLYRGRYTHGWMLLLVALWYVLAKLFEGYDGLVYQWLGHMSGHGIKHLLAAMACAQVIWMLQVRRSMPP